jgi:flavin-binding protein dodecin
MRRLSAVDHHQRMVEVLLDTLGIGPDVERATRVERAHALGIVAPIPGQQQETGGGRFQAGMLLTSPRARSRARTIQASEDDMAKKQAETVYKIVEVVGVSEKSWEEAGRRAVETAASSLRDLRVAEVMKMDMKVEDGKVAAFRTRVSLSFKYEA